MKTVVFSIILFLSISASAQCDIKTQKDEFTGKTTKFSSSLKIIQHGSSPVLKSLSQWAGNKCFYKVYFQFLIVDSRLFVYLSEDADNCMCTITSASFKFADGKVLLKKNLKPGRYIDTDIGHKQYVSFEMTKEELQQFAASEVEKVRLEEDGCSDHPVVTEDLEDKAAEAIQALAGCIAKDLPNK